MTIQLVDVYHSGKDRLRAPFLLVKSGWPRTRLPAPQASWTFWKTVPINLIAVSPEKAALNIKEQGYFIQ